MFSDHISYNIEVALSCGTHKFVRVINDESLSDPQQIIQPGMKSTICIAIIIMTMTITITTTTTITTFIPVLKTNS